MKNVVHWDCALKTSHILWAHCTNVVKGSVRVIGSQFVPLNRFNEKWENFQKKLNSQIKLEQEVSTALNEMNHWVTVSVLEKAFFNKTTSKTEILRADLRLNSIQCCNNSRKANFNNCKPRRARFGAVRVSQYLWGAHNNWKSWCFQENQSTKENWSCLPVLALTVRWPEFDHFFLSKFQKK